MAKRKFKKKPFRDWLDCLARIVVKTDDNFTCQIQQSPNCAGQMMPLDRNCQWCHIKSRSRNDLRWDIDNSTTGCGACHQWGHANPNQFGLWFATNYPGRNKLINDIAKLPPFSWKEDDYRTTEEDLLVEAKNISVDYMNIPERFRMRLKRKLEELKGD